MVSQLRELGQSERVAVCWTDLGSRDNHPLRAGLGWEIRKIEVGVLIVCLIRMETSVFLMSTSNSFNLSFFLVSMMTAVCNIAVRK